jgi:multidrug efflux pump subunit AcrA (membrane-fusion protein)
MFSSLSRLHGFIFFLLLISLLYSCHGEKKEATQASAVDVTVIKAEPRTVSVTFEWVGQTESSRLVEIRARVEGFLDKIAYKQGDLAKEGDLLFQIDPRPLKPALERAKGILAQEEARLLRARREFAPVKTLFEQNAVSERYLDNAEAEMTAAEASVVGYEQTVLLALEETENALVDFDRQQARYDFLREPAQASEKAVELAQLRYRYGVADFLTVLDAERTLLEA